MYNAKVVTGVCQAKRRYIWEWEECPLQKGGKGSKGMLNLSSSTTFLLFYVPFLCAVFRLTLLGHLYPELVVLSTSANEELNNLGQSDLRFPSSP